MSMYYVLNGQKVMARGRREIYQNSRKVVAMLLAESGGPDPDVFIAMAETMKNTRNQTISTTGNRLAGFTSVAAMNEYMESYGAAKAGAVGA